MTKSPFDPEKPRSRPVLMRLPSSERKFHYRFPQLPSNEPLIFAVQNCIWRKDSPTGIRGWLYLSENYIGFYSSTRSPRKADSSRKVLIEIESVTRVTKVRSLNIFPDGVAIQTADSQKYVFTQLFSRNRVYSILCEMCGVQPDHSRRGSFDPKSNFINPPENDHDLSAKNSLMLLQSVQMGGSRPGTASLASSNSGGSIREESPSRSLSSVEEALTADEFDVEDQIRKPYDPPVNSHFSDFTFDRSNSRCSSCHKSSLRSVSPVVIEHTEIGTLLIKVLTSIVAFFMLTALLTLYNIYEDYNRQQRPIFEQARLKDISDIGKSLTQFADQIKLLMQYHSHALKSGDHDLS